MGQVSPQVAEALRLARTDDRSVSPWGGKVEVKQSKAWGMRGDGAPTGMLQMHFEDTATEETEEAK